MDVRLATRNRGGIEAATELHYRLLGLSTVGANRRSALVGLRQARQGEQSIWPILAQGYALARLSCTNRSMMTVPFPTSPFFPMI